MPSNKNPIPPNTNPAPSNKIHAENTLPSRNMSPSEVRAFFDAHRTTRQYQVSADGGAIPMPADHLSAILHAAQRAPTDATTQLYTLIHLESPELKQELAQRTKNAHLATAGAAFVVCLDVYRLRRLLEAAGKDAGEWPSIALHFGVGDAALAGQNLLTAAEMMGYQGCWVGGVLNDLAGIVERLRLPAGVLPYAALTVGLPAETPPLRPRLPRELVVHQNTYQPYTGAALRAGIEQMNPIAARGGKEGDWARLLHAYWGEGRSMQQREGALSEALREQGLG